MSEHAGASSSIASPPLLSSSLARRALAVLAIAIGLLALALFVRHEMRANPDWIWLEPEAGARWIRRGEPFDLVRRPATRIAVMFRKRFTVAALPLRADLTVRALQMVLVQLDGKPVGTPRNEPERWKEPREFDLAPLLGKGEHTLVLGVLRDNGRPCVLAHASGIDLATGTDWEASVDGQNWSPAVDVETPPDVEPAHSVPGTAESLRRSWPIFAAIFIGAAAASFARSRRDRPLRAIDAARVRWVVLGAWIVLALNNVAKIPNGIGFDLSGHLEYLHYVAEHGSLPLANQGWQMYQAPLYYVVSAPLLRLLTALSIDVEQGLRIVPLACGALQVEVVYRTMRFAFPDRPREQAIGTWIGGLLPMNVYIAQTVGNETMSGVLSACVILACVRFVASDESERSLRRAAFLGACLGAALLAKMSALVLVPIVLACAAWGSWRRTRSARTASTDALVAAAVALIVCGWFYARNWIELGKPFVGNWDWKIANRIWWQDPSYRTPAELERFGTALVQPAWAGIQGLWDALYASLWADGGFSGSLSPPPWNFTFVAATVWLSLPITLAIACGVFVRLRGPSQRARTVAVAACALFAISLVTYSLEHPIYSAAKSTYALATTPCIALLAAAFFGRIAERGVAIRAAVCGLLACWGVAAYASYFVI